MKNSDSVDRIQSQNNGCVFDSSTFWCDLFKIIG